jgi:hypothetical protein
MDCLSIQKNSKDGHYWTNASNFFQGNYAHGFEYFKQLADELKKKKPNFANVNPEENFQQRKEQFRDVRLFLSSSRLKFHNVIFLAQLDRRV